MLGYTGMVLLVSQLVFSSLSIYVYLPVITFRPANTTHLIWELLRIFLLKVKTKIRILIFQNVENTCLLPDSSLCLTEQNLAEPAEVINFRLVNIHVKRSCGDF